MRLFVKPPNQNSFLTLLGVKAKLRLLELIISANKSKPYTKEEIETLSTVISQLLVDVHHQYLPKEFYKKLFEKEFETKVVPHLSADDIRSRVLTSPTLMLMAVALAELIKKIDPVEPSHRNRHATPTNETHSGNAPSQSFCFTQ